MWFSMDVNKKIELVIELVDRFDSYNRYREQLYNLIGFNLESDVALSIGFLTELAISRTSELIGDRSEWLFWYIFENDCGRKGLELVFGSEKRKICSVLDIIWCIESV